MGPAPGALAFSLTSGCHAAASLPHSAETPLLSSLQALSFLPLPPRILCAGDDSHSCLAAPLAAPPGPPAGGYPTIRHPSPSLSVPSHHPQETIPIHAWLHPWLPHLGPQLESFYPTIRHRLASALAAWHPADDSARLLLAPWRRVFDAGDWDALLARSIAPKLALALQVGVDGGV